MSEHLKPVPNQPNGQPITGSFADVAFAALVERKVPNICRECFNAMGWNDWEIIQAPTMLPLAPPTVGGVPAVCLVCRKCGYIRTFALAYLGIKVEQRRVITPDEAKVN